MPWIFIFMMLIELSCSLRITVPSGVLIGANTSIHLLYSDNDPSNFVLRTFLNDEGRLDASKFSMSVTNFMKDTVFYASFAYIGNYSIMAFLNSE
ncbi:uncharacterized protein EV420DRAFT_518118 [Desarmillaria tabescens]|uniref:Uncharacterized protein n=1 Tax=Armillaria tabescens TaxID=1929756 RepID=A0AA39K9Z0_ARMTA|nr:uncharacterized protein EV420DRAFT_518118 [Desarmillaria tabescens]KAK0457297.1 hypothetical protein EV420DRAFT_518118 [Desarmillaria tabescens]